MQKTEFTSFMKNSLEEVLTSVDNFGYAHRLLKEKSELRSEIIDELKRVTDEAHRDAKKKTQKSVKYFFVSPFPQRLRPC